MKKEQHNALKYGQKQQGFSLVMALGFMVFLTLIVISMVNVTSSDEKIARNSRDKDLAFAAAEAAMRDAEMYITGSYTDPYTPPDRTLYDNLCTNALCDFMPPNIPVNLEKLNFFSTSDLIAKNSIEIGSITKNPTIKGVNAQPRYLIEQVSRNSGIPNDFEYRITVQSQGKSANTLVTLQELYYLDHR